MMNISKALLVWVSCFFFSFTIHSQNTYYKTSLNIDTVLYQSLNDSLRLQLNHQKWTDRDTFKIALGFDFVWEDDTINSIVLFGHGGVIFKKKCSMSESPAIVLDWEIYDRSFYLFGPDTTISPIYYLTSGVIGQRVLTIEWQNASTTHDEEDTINFQLKINELDNSIHIHFGEIITNSWSFLHVSEQFGPLLYSKGNNCPNEQNTTVFAIKEEFGTIELLQVEGAFNPFEFNLLTLPLEGTIFKFTLDIATGIDKFEQEVPKKNIFNFHSAYKELEVLIAFDDDPTLQILNMNGQVVFERRMKNYRHSLYQLPVGIYIGRIITSEGRIYHDKFVITH